MQKGDKVFWKGVNRMEFGALLWEKGGGNWYVSLPNGKAVIVNVKSMRDAQGRPVAES